MSGSRRVDPGRGLRGGRVRVPGAQRMGDGVQEAALQSLVDDPVAEFLPAHHGGGGPHGVGGPQSALRRERGHGVVHPPVLGRDGTDAMEGVDGPVHPLAVFGERHVEGTARRLLPTAPLHVPVLVRERVEGVGKFPPRLGVVTVELSEETLVVGRGDDAGEFLDGFGAEGFGDGSDAGFVAEQVEDAEGREPAVTGLADPAVPLHARFVGTGAAGTAVDPLDVTGVRVRPGISDHLSVEGGDGDVVHGVGHAVVSWVLIRKRAGQLVARRKGIAGSGARAWLEVAVRLDEGRCVFFPRRPADPEGSAVHEQRRRPYRPGSATRGLLLENGKRRGLRERARNCVALLAVLHAARQLGE